MLLDQLIYHRLFELSAYGVQEKKEKKVEIKKYILQSGTQQRKGPNAYIFPLLMKISSKMAFTQRG